MNKNTEYNYSIKQAESFKRELRNIYEYICYELKEPNIAIKLINLITEKINIIKQYPLTFEILLKRENLEYRKFIVKNYVIIYRVNLENREVYILHIYNQRKNKRKLFQ